MAGIYSALGELDRMRKMAGRRVKDLVKDPLGVLTQQADDLRNTQRGVEPVINPAGAGMRQIPREEQVSRMTQQALDTYAGGLGMLGHTVFHGSPHRFTKFDKSRMGTGEGIQAFGKGMYVAENRGIADQYAKNLANRDHANQNRLSPHANAKRLADIAGDPKYAADDIRFALEVNPDHDQKELLTETLRYLDSGKYKEPLESPGHLYKIDIPDEAVPRMLDWDKPLKEQPAKVQKALKKLGVTQPAPAPQEAVEAAKEAYRANPSRENLQAMNALMNQGRNIMGSDIIKQKLATEEALQQAGIPGIKYLDAGSREGGGTSNMVVFSPEMMRILERNGEATGAKPWAAGEWGGRAPTEFEARHAAAQRNAALPVEQGGLGLPPNNTAMDRARAMGFDTPAYHATLADVDKFKKNKVTAYGDRFFFSPDANYANEFAPLDSTIAGHTDKVKAWKEKNAGGAGQNIMPVMLKSEAMKDWTHISPEYVVKDPSAIRSRFAAFDPMKRHDADMLGFASPQLLGGMGLGGAGMAAYGLQDDQEGIFSRLGQYLRQRGMQ